MTNRRLLPVALAVATGASAGAAALVSAQDGGIDACVFSGASSPAVANVRILQPGETCDSGRETARTWNVQGPMGPRGEIGPTGPPGQQGTAGVAGPPGPAGPAGVVQIQGASAKPKIKIPPGAVKEVKPPPGPASGVYQVHDQKFRTLGPDTGSAVRLVRLGLPKGNYVMQAQVHVHSTAAAPGPAPVFCLIAKDAHSYLDRIDRPPGSDFTLHWTGSLKQPTVVQVRCGYDPDDDTTVSVYVDHLRALAVDKVTLTKD